MACYNRGEELRERIEGDFVYIERGTPPLWPGEFVNGECEAADEVANGNSEFREEAGDTLPTDMSDTGESEPDKHNSNGEEEKCTSYHVGKLLLQQEFPFNVDQLFTMIFTNSKFNLELLAARNSTDYVQNPWQPKNGLKYRQVSYTLGLKSGPMGPKEVHVTETQVMNKCSKPGALYSIDCTSENAGIPYADYFNVRAHYCLLRRGERTLLAIHGHVHYNKTMWPLIKAFLEKNAMGGMEEFTRMLEARLLAAARPTRPTRPLAYAPQTCSRRCRTHDVSLLAPHSAGVSSLESPVAGVSPGARPAAPPPQPRSRWLALALLLLLALNALLYWRLYHVERTGLDLDHLHTRMTSLSESLETHATRQRRQLLAWQAAQHSTVGHLLQTEQALKILLETIKPALERADQETEPREEL